MKASELRIGDWVEYKGEVYQVFNGIYKGCCDLDSEILDQNIPHVSLENIRGVKLREEILLKSGFIKDKSINELKYFKPIPNLKCEFHATFFRGQFVIELLNHLIPIVTEVEYLHQLQNLYFALKGEELNIEL